MSRALAEMVFSRSCEGCGAHMTAEAGCLCWDCQTQVKPVRLPFCERCGDPVPGLVTDTFECAWCRRHRPGFVWARSAVRYDGVAKEMIRRLKYGAALWNLDVLVEWLAALWQTAPAEAREADWITAVPLYARRMRDRGFNQAALLAEGLARRVGLPFRSNAVSRFRATASQTRLTAAQRLHNVRGVFAVPRPRRVAHARIVLVDDVMTTGATVHECARVLRAAGAAAVMVLTVARG